VKRIDKQIKEEREIKLQKKAKLTQKRVGYIPINQWDKFNEKHLLKSATRGVIKLFNSIYDFRKKIKEDKEKEGKSHNLS
jgi:hypothetical protein